MRIPMTPERLAELRAYATFELDDEKFVAVEQQLWFGLLKVAEASRMYLTNTVHELADALSEALERLEKAKHIFDVIDAEGGHGFKVHGAIAAWRSASEKKGEP
jgi:hypothetical protein